MKLKSLIALLILSLQFIGINHALAQAEKEHSWLRRKLFQEPLINYDDGFSDSTLILAINPIVAFGTVNEAGENKIFNTRGFVMSAYVGKKIRVFSRLEESQAELPFYANSFYKANNTIPEYARLKAFKTNGVDYTFASGHISYSVKKYLIFFLGNSRPFLNSVSKTRDLQVGHRTYPLNYFGGRYYNPQPNKGKIGKNSILTTIDVEAKYISGINAERDTLFTTSEGLLRKTNGFYVKGHFYLFGRKMWRESDKKKLKTLSFWEMSNAGFHFSTIGLGLKPTTDIPAPVFPIRSTLGVSFYNRLLGRLDISFGKEFKQSGFTKLIKYFPQTFEFSKRLTFEGELYYASSTQKQSNLTQAGLYLGLPYVNNAEVGIVANLTLLQRGSLFKKRAEFIIKANHFLKESTVLGAQQTLDVSARYIINPRADYAVQAGYVSQKLYTLTEAKPYVYFGFFANINHKPINF